MWFLETTRSAGRGLFLWLTSFPILVWTGVSPAAFEISGQGARASAVGGAVTATVGDVDGVWINAAANGRQKYLKIGTTHALLYPSLEGTITLNSLAAVVPAGNGSVHAGLSILDFSGWKEHIAAVGYGKGLLDRFAVGGTIRFSGWRAEALSHRSISLDFGGTYEVGWIFPEIYLRLGAVLSNANRANISAGGYAAGQTPIGAILGASINMDQEEILVDVEHRGGISQVRLGYETRSLGWGGARLRLGMAAWSAENVGKIGAGLGRHWKQWNLDYAYSLPVFTTGGLGGIHRFSIGYHSF